MLIVETEYWTVWATRLSTRSDGANEDEEFHDCDDRSPAATRSEHVAFPVDAGQVCAFYIGDEPEFDVVVAFRGGGTLEDTKHHPGSPCRTFIEGVDETTAPSHLPSLALLDVLRDGQFEKLDAVASLRNAEEFPGGKEQKQRIESNIHALLDSTTGTRMPSSSSSGPRSQISFVGYSQGCIPALACALRTGQVAGDSHPHWFRGCHMLSPVTMFWPTWFSNPSAGSDNGTAEQEDMARRGFLEESWWAAHIPQMARRGKLVSWVVADDPFADGVPGQYKAPLFPGVTFVLPAQCFGANIKENHNLEHFIKPSGERTLAAR
eukprot:gnl/TRDRNA2_/TRDRNA2_148856_c1_seq1.p1 gnl/TRDRNA2_/TRDRNA2_148856_c1~~gnl/TRDRNA2_/TRDRNA2_148856_c1_seq1.p1  ORF type:complete len:321 (+),score=44.38 gnl/TRDRNA2_/TRDRNA2_148856_c1_seq1:1-963(+)